MIKSRLQELVEQVFSVDGSIVQCGGRYNAQQASYANYVVQALEGQGSVTAMLEAETGIGKTLVYLISSLICLNLQEKPNKIIISTYTRMLQRQILSTDLTFAVEVLRHIGIENKVKCAYRMGKQAFFSPTRTENHINQMKVEHPQFSAEYDEFLRFVNASCFSGSGLWLDWIEENLNFPPHVSGRDVSLLQHQVVDSPAYKEHLELAANADLLITNHMTILSQSFDDEYHAIFFDEAHEINGVCTQLFNHKLPLLEVMNTLEKVKRRFLNKRYIVPFINMVKEWDATLRTQDTSHNFWTDRTHKKLIDAQTEMVQQALNSSSKCEKDLKKVYSGGALDADAAEILSKIEGFNHTFKKWMLLDQTYQQRAIGFSAKHRNPSVASLNIYAGRIFAKRIRAITNRIILVSATLSDAKRELSFKSTCFNLGLDENPLIKCSISPENYGNMEFVLCDPAIPKPVIVDGEDILFSGDWLKNAVAMINSALSNGESVLVLAQSFNEAKELAQHLNNPKVQHHVKGKPLDMYIKNLVEGVSQCLITPSAWEGVSIRKPDGSQLLKHVMITRIPFKPIDGLVELFRSERGTKNFMWLEQSYHAVYKLKQGMGRGNRSPTDNVVIHFCDPRMPHYNDSRTGNQNLISAIPKRFMNNYAQAKVFGKETVKMVMI